MLINDRLEAMISDFGLTQVLMYLRPGTPSGSSTPDTALAYTAPELATTFGRPNRESDVYAFGGLALAVSLQRHD